jgi:hypothetical protein
VDDLQQARRAIDELDRKSGDVVVVPVHRLPEELLDRPRSPAPG